MAIKLAHLKSKSWIINQYLNTVPFGQQATAWAPPPRPTSMSRPSSSPSRRPRCWPRWSTRPACSTPTRTPAPSTRALVARWQYVLYNMYRDGNISLLISRAVGLTSAGITSCRRSQELPQGALPLRHVAWTADQGYLMNMVEQELIEDLRPDPDPAGHRRPEDLHRRSARDDERARPRGAARARTQMRADGKALPWYAHVGAVLEQPATGAILAVYGGPGYGVKNCDQVYCDVNMAEDPEAGRLLVQALRAGHRGVAGHERADQHPERILAALDPGGHRRSPTGSMLSSRTPDPPRPRFRPTCPSTKPARTAGR